MKICLISGFIQLNKDASDNFDTSVEILDKSRITHKLMAQWLDVRQLDQTYCLAEAPNVVLQMDEVDDDFPEKDLVLTIKANDTIKIAILIVQNSIMFCFESWQLTSYKRARSTLEPIKKT